MLIQESGTGNYIVLKGKKYSYFGGNNYLGLATHQELKKAAILAIKKYGVNFSASRITTGTSALHLELERKLSDFKKKNNTIIFPSGYQGNSILLDALATPDTVVLVDSFAHPSITEHIPANVHSIKYYDHCNTDHLEKLLEDLPEEVSPLIITDGVFALTGEIAPLDRIYPLARKYNGKLVVDDAHSTGILGDHGRGTPEYFNIMDEESVFQSETMSKALGSYGGFISGTNDFIEMLRRSSIYRASTALPPHVVAAGIASLNVISKNPAMRVNLINRAKRIKGELARLEFRSYRDGTPIIPVLFETPDAALDLSAFLEKNKIIVPALDYPGNLDKFIIRISLSVTHTDQQVDDLLETIKKWRDKNGTTGN